MSRALINGLHNAVKITLSPEKINNDKQPLYLAFTNTQTTLLLKRKMNCHFLFSFVKRSQDSIVIFVSHTDGCQKVLSSVFANTWNTLWSFLYDSVLYIGNFINGI